MDSPNIGNAELITQVNRTLVLQAVRALQPTFRAEVSRWTNLNPATVTSITADLLKARLLKAVPGEPRSVGPAGGRPPMMLELNSNARQILAIDLEPDVLRVALLGLNINVVAYQEELLDRRGRPEAVLDRMVAVCKQVIAKAPRRRLDGIGLSLPGLIDREQGILISSTNMPKWRNVPIRDLLIKRLGVEPKVERACHLAALYEDWVDRAGPNNTKLVFSLRTGIGMSLVRDGELYLGAGGLDGEVGHTVIDLDGPLCECGNTGCLETFVRADAVRDRVDRMLASGRGAAIAAAIKKGKALRPELVYQLAKEGDADAAEIVLDVGRYIGLAAANLVNILAPDVFVLCGSIDTADELILRSIREQIDRRALPQIKNHLQIRLGVGKDRIGACSGAGSTCGAFPVRIAEIGEANLCTGRYADRQVDDVALPPAGAKMTLSGIGNCPIVPSFWRSVSTGVQPRNCVKCRCFLRNRHHSRTSIWYTQLFL